MKKVLIISYYFPPSPEVGSLRIGGLVKYLPEFGWEPIVLTNNAEKFFIQKKNIIHYDSNSSNNFTKERKVGVKNRLFDKLMFDILLNIVQELTSYPSDLKIWQDYALKEAITILNNEKIDVVISSSSPVTCHIMAHKLTSRFNIPWIADLRDLWTQNHNLCHSFVRLYMERQLELKILSSSNILTTVSEPLAEKLRSLHKEKKVFCIFNGFDPDNINFSEPSGNKLHISYTGKVYKGKQDPEPFFKALDELISEKLLKPEDIIVNFYGPDQGWINEYIVNTNLQDVVQLRGFVPRNEILDIQRSSHLLLLLNWNDPKENGVYTGKIFEYLAARRSIFSIGFGGVVANLLNETNAGINISTVNEIKKEFMKYYLEFKNHRKIYYNGIPSEIDKYSHREMAKKFAMILDKLDDAS